MNLVNNTLSVLATSAVRIPLQFGTSVILARYLSVEDRGLYAVAVAFATMMTLLLELGLGPASIYRLRRAESPPSQVATGILAMVIALSAFAVLAGLPLEEWITSRFLDDAPADIFYIALALVPLHLLMIVGGSLARGLDRFALQNGSQILTFATRLAGVSAVLVLFGGELRGALRVYLATEALGMLAVLVAVVRQTGLEWRVHAIEVRESLRFGLRAYVARTAGALHNGADLFLIAYFLGDPQQAAFYAVAISLRALLLMVPEASALALFPQLAGTPERSTGDLTARVLRNSLVFVVLAASAGGIAAPLIPIIFSAPYEASIPPYLVLLLGTVMFSVHRLLSNYFAALGRQGASVRGQLLATSLNLVLNVLLIPQMGILGAALANLASNSAAAAYLTYAFCRDSGLAPSALFRPRRADLEVYQRHLESLLKRARRSRPLGP